MKLHNEIEIADFLKAVTEAQGEVWLESYQGDKYNLKSTLSRYVAIAAMIGDHSDELELYCQKKDEHLFMKFFKDHPDSL